MSVSVKKGGRKCTWRVEKKTRDSGRHVYGREQVKDIFLSVFYPFC